MTKITGNEPAYSNPGMRDSDRFIYAPGLTIRQHFAAMAMQGFIANPDEAKREYWRSKIPELADCKNNAEFVVKSSVMMADALIAELNKELNHD